MTYLAFDTPSLARARSEQAWLDCGYGAGGTRYLWSRVEHPSDGRAALVIPATPGEAQIGLAPGDYEALLSEDERAALVAVLPEDWTAA